MSKTIGQFFCRCGESIYDQLAAGSAQTWKGFNRFDIKLLYAESYEVVNKLLCATLRVLYDSSKFLV